MQKTFLALLLLSLAFSVNAQFNNRFNDRRISRRDIIADSAIADKAAMGIGLGFDYGGIGVGAAVYVNKNFGFIGGLGYALVGAGFNAGIKYRFYNEKPVGVVPFLVAMYGYNAAVKLDYDGTSGPESVHKIYYGPSFGAGLDTKYREGKQGYWSFTLLVPIRAQEYTDEINNFQNAGGTFFSKPLPVAFSVGYKWVIN